VTETK